MRLASRFGYANQIRRDRPLPDHLIIGGSQVFSFAEHGLL